MGRYSEGDHRSKGSDSGSLTVKVLVVCVVVLVALDGLNRQHELVVESPHIQHIQLPQTRPEGYVPPKTKKKANGGNYNRQHELDGNSETAWGVESGLGAGSFEGTGMVSETEVQIPGGEFTAVPLQPKPGKKKGDKKKKEKPAVDIGSIRPKCSSARCRQRAAQLRAELRRQRREEQTLLLFPIREHCGYNSTKELLTSGPEDVVMSGESWKVGGRLKMPKVIPPPGDTKSNMSLWLENCPTFKSLFVGSVNGELVDSGIIPDKDPLKYHIRHKHDSCAIIGNGGGLLLAPLGEQIDKHDAVFRFNGGPTFGFEESVGKRTTYRLDNSQHFLYHEPGTHEIILQHITSREMFNQMKEEAEIMVNSEGSDLRVHVIDPMFHHYVMNVNRIGAPSNGFFGIVLSHLICNQVTLFGYQKDWRGQNIPYHYYDEIEPILGQWDRDNREKVQLENIIEMINTIAEESEDWNTWKMMSGWSYRKVVYAEERFGSMYADEIPEKYKVYHPTAPGANLPPLDEEGNLIMPPAEGDGEGEGEGGGGGEEGEEGEEAPPPDTPVEEEEVPHNEPPF
ncbi:sialyltransferase [Chloropicon primus]|uniref:Sialyltransferase n=1 Tax=Chloropicon primus TaxID=1764295 RepID=A0A5B8MJS1_9CHLO|nr:sialyltransferase [Chloropicon primus]UPR00071.1 sialyltransferase [Chloropicon primus]|eukprot:QDZ20858.1 sialyltransferase [Chloropicon primus]